MKRRRCGQLAKTNLANVLMASIDRKFQDRRIDRLIWWFVGNFEIRCSSCGMDKTNVSGIAAALSRPRCIIVFICALWSLVTWLFLHPVEVLGSRGYLLCRWFYCIVCYVV